MQSTLTAAPSITSEPDTETLPRELAYRRNDGIQVVLMWHPADDAVPEDREPCR